MFILRIVVLRGGVEAPEQPGAEDQDKDEKGGFHVRVMVFFSADSRHLTK
jgi:hypothetical protein